VARSFEILIPVMVVIGTLHPLNLFIEAQTGMIIPQAIMHLLEPLVSASDSLPAILLSVLLCQIFWFAGIHGSLIVTGIMNPFWMANLSANQAALAAGAALPHVYLQGFWDHYLLIGGVGSTLPLAFLRCAAALPTCAPSAKWAWCPASLTSTNRFCSARRSS
jgi:PTS system cellobiose-specific IIC component